MKIRKKGRVRMKAWGRVSSVRRLLARLARRVARPEAFSMMLLQGVLAGKSDRRFVQRAEEVHICDPGGAPSRDSRSEDVPVDHGDDGRNEHARAGRGCEVGAAAQAQVARVPARRRHGAGGFRGRRGGRQRYIGWPAAVARTACSWRHWRRRVTGRRRFSCFRYHCCRGSVWACWLLVGASFKGRENSIAISRPALLGVIDCCRSCQLPPSDAEGCSSMIQRSPPAAMRL